MVEALEVKNLSFKYGNTPILTDVSFKINKGDFLAIVGPNGTGKTTLLKLILGELKSDQGVISIFSKNITDFKQWYRIGYIAQNEIGNNDNFPATVEEVVGAHLYSSIGLFKSPNQKHKEKTINALKLVGMEDYLKRQISKLSGGQQQRVLIASALVNNPEVMLLDEPTTGVDGKTVMELYILLKKINEETGVTIVMITHDIYRAHKYVTRTLCLEECSLVELEKEQVNLEQFYKHKHN